MFSKFLQNNPLYKECIEALKVGMLSKQEADDVTTLFKLMVPLTRWGKVDWSKIDKKIEVGYDPNDIIPFLEGLFGGSFNTSVYVEWSMNVPSIKTDIKSIVSNYDDVACVAPETFIFNPDVGYVIEILVSGQITAGLIPNYEELFLKKK